MATPRTVPPGPTTSNRWPEVLLCVLACLTAAGCAPRVGSSAVTYQIIDAETRRPVEGALIAATWEMQGDHGIPAGALETQEHRTDSTGTFVISAWRKRIPSVWLSIDASEPKIRILATGYCPVVLLQKRAVLMSDTRQLTDLTPNWGPTKLRLTARRAEEGSCKDGDLWLLWSADFLRNGRCTFNEVPRFTRALHEMSVSAVTPELARELYFVRRLLQFPECQNLLEVLGVSAK